MAGDRIDNIDRAEVVINRMKRGVLTLAAGLGTAEALLEKRAPAGRGMDKAVLVAELHQLDRIGYSMYVRRFAQDDPDGGPGDGDVAVELPLGYEKCVLGKVGAGLAEHWSQ